MRFLAGGCDRRSLPWWSHRRLTMQHGGTGHARRPRVFSCQHSPLLVLPSGSPKETKRLWSRYLLMALAFANDLCLAFTWPAAIQ